MLRFGAPVFYGCVRAQRLILLDSAGFLACSVGVLNDNLHSAKLAKKDEFYTQLSDIENELQHYKEHFAGKVVFCNCDDPFESNFAKYFLLNFNDLKLKKLICTSYNGSTVTETEFPLVSEDHPSRKKGRSRIAYLLKVSKVRDVTDDGAVGLNDVKKLLKKHPPKLLKGNGDFRSSECVELLKEADIVVTNPPFSLFREYVAQLIEYKKKFLIIGNKNAITYKEIFPLIKGDKMWIGVTSMSKDLHFFIPKEYIEDAVKKNRRTALAESADGKILGRSPSVWFTNLDHGKRHEKLELHKHYAPGEYSHFDHSDRRAINVNKVSDIPCDFYGVMGVPITFLDKYCPEQFEIIGCSYDYGRPSVFPTHTRMEPVVEGKSIYKRLLIWKRIEDPPLESPPRTIPLFDTPRKRGKRSVRGRRRPKPKGGRTSSKSE